MASKGFGKNSYKVQVREDPENGASSGQQAARRSSLGMTCTNTETNSPSRQQGCVFFLLYLRFSLGHFCMRRGLLPFRESEQAPERLRNRPGFPKFLRGETWRLRFMISFTTGVRLSRAGNREGTCLPISVDRKKHCHP